MKKKAIVYLTVVSLLTGTLLSLLINSYRVQAQSVTLEAMWAALIQLELETSRVEAENRTLLSEINKIQSMEDQTSMAAQQLDDARLTAGLTALSGPGIRIILDDSDRLSEIGDDISLGFIHEKNLRDIVNALRNAGAEGIAINDQRLTTHSEIFCNGAFILINNTLQRPPYIITAIGNPKNLEAGLHFYFWEALEVQQNKYGITRQVELPEKPVTIPAARPYTYRYAEPVEGG